MPWAQPKVGNPRRANGTKRDAVRKRVLREESVCHLCGQVVDKTLVLGLPGSPEVDELVPVSQGGSPFDRANCRLSHRYCNNKRSHRPVEPVRSQLRADPPMFDAFGGIDRMANVNTWTSRTW